VGVADDADVGAGELVLVLALDGGRTEDPENVNDAVSDAPDPSSDSASPSPSEGGHEAYDGGGENVAEEFEEDEDEGGGKSIGGSGLQLSRGVSPLANGVVAGVVVLRCPAGRVSGKAEL
jgi:hypothetical protein